MIPLREVRAAWAGGQRVGGMWVGGSKVWSASSSPPPVQPAVDLTMMQMDAGRIYQRASDTGGEYGNGEATVTVSFTTTAPFTSIHHRLRDADSGAVLRDWTISSTGGTAGTHSLDVTVPARKGDYFLDLRANGDDSQIVSGTSRFGVGRIIAVSGQSLAARMFSHADTNITAFVHQIDPHCRCYALVVDSGLPANNKPAVWAAPTNGGQYSSVFAAEYLRLQAEEFGVSCALVGATWGGQSISTIRGKPELWTILGYIGAWEETIWMQGHTDARNNVPYATYQTELNSLASQMEAINELTPHWSLETLPNITSGSWGTPAAITEIRRAGADWVAVKGGHYVHAYDIALYDGVHQSQAGNLTLAQHFHRASLGEQAGPRVLSASRASDTADVIVTLDRWATMPVAGNRFAAFVAGDRTTPLSIASVGVSGPTVTLTLASAPANEVALDVLAEYPPSPTDEKAGVIYASSEDGLALGRPLAPAFAAITAAAPGGAVVTPPPTGGAKLGPDLITMGSGTPAFAASATSAFGQALVSPPVKASSVGGNLPPAAPWTAEVRFERDAPENRTEVIMEISGRFWIALNSSSRPFVSIWNDGGTELRLTGSTGIIDWSQPHHIALVVTGSDARVYLDGAMVASGAITPSAATMANPLTFKAQISGANTSTVRVSEAATWSIEKYTGPFTPPALPYTGNEPGLVSLYHFDGDLLAAVKL